MPSSRRGAYRGDAQRWRRAASVKRKKDRATKVPKNHDVRCHHCPHGKLSSSTLVLRNRSKVVGAVTVATFWLDCTKCGASGVDSPEFDSVPDWWVMANAMDSPNEDNGQVPPPPPPRVHESSFHEP